MLIFAWRNIYMKKRIHKLFFYTLLVGVYGIFFSVESFCNFEGQTNGQDFIRFAAHICQHAKDGHVARSVPLRSASSHNVRLNKRFYQADMPPCPVLAPQSPLSLLSPLVLGSRRSNDLSELAALYRALRGPPAIG
jgi:hypothetical protein